jgi:microcystin-dependent protein
MAFILFPRSDSVSPKVIEPSDFEQMFDFLEDYVKSGFVVAAGSGLAVTVTSGYARLKGLVCHNDSTATVSSLTANNTNYLYLTLSRDGGSEALTFSITKNITGTTATDSMKIAKVICGASTVTSVSQLNLIDIASTYSFQPTGTVQMYGGQYNNIPNNWLLCDGSAISRTTYDKLYDVVGTQFGVGDGSSTFNLPDLRAKFPRGATNTANAGTTGGEDSHTLTGAESGTSVHTHGTTDPGHTHSYSGGGNISNNYSPYNYPRLQTYSNTSGASINSGTTGLTVNNSSNANASSAHENRPAFLELLYMIRI